MAKHAQHPQRSSTRSGSRRRIYGAVALLVVIALVGLSAVWVSGVEHNRDERVDHTEGTPTATAPAAGSDADALVGDVDKSPVPAVDPAAAASAEADAQAQQRMNALRSQLEGTLANYPGQWQVYVEDLASEESVQINNRQQPSASIIKLYVMLAVYQGIADGTLKENTTVDGLLREMITVSSNQATNSLIAMLGNGSNQAGFEVVNRTAAQYGFTQTQITDLLYDSGSHDPNSKQTSSLDAGHFMACVYRRQLVNSQASESMLNLLLGQTRLNKIPSGLPNGTRSANKTGEIPGVENDAAIVFLGDNSEHSDYVLVVMSQDVNNATAQQEIRTLSSTVWNTLSG